MNKLSLDKRRGSVLATLLIFVVVGVIIAGGAVSISIANTIGASNFLSGNKALRLAEGGIEESLIRILRDRNYTGGTINIEGSDVIINVSGNITKTITSEVVWLQNKRTIEVIVDMSNNKLVILSWKEI